MMVCYTMILHFMADRAITCCTLWCLSMSYYSTPYDTIPCYITPCCIIFVVISVLISVTLLMIANASDNINPNHVHNGNSVDAMVVSRSIPTHD